MFACANVVVNGALQHGKELTSHVDKLLELQATADRQKKEQMFAEWEEKVFNPIAESITKQIDDVVSPTLPAHPGAAVELNGA